MTTDEKLAAILAAVQTDPGNRGLARDPHDNLFTATAGDFTAACKVLASGDLRVNLYTGFYIATGDPPAFESDGPLGAVFLARAFTPIGGWVRIFGEEVKSFEAVQSVTAPPLTAQPTSWSPGAVIWLERAGPAADGCHYTMRGRDISTHLNTWWTQRAVAASTSQVGPPSIGIGDGGNEIGMGKVPHETIVKNIPNGDLIHCRVPTNYLIVAGVSNWGAYALAAGVYALRGVKPPADLFDPDREQEILGVMVREGPLVDGVTGKQTATVDGLSWEEYAKPLVRIREILES